MFYMNMKLYKSWPLVTKKRLLDSTENAHRTVKPLLHEFVTRDNKWAVAEFWPATGDWTVTIED